MRRKGFLTYSLFVLAAAALLSSCQALKPAAQASVPAKAGARSPYLDHISIASGNAQAGPSQDASMPELKDETYAPRFYFNHAFNIEQSIGNQFRYAILMDVEVEQLANQPLYRYIDDWWGTPYRMGGSGRQGIDCSAFVQGLMASVYGLSMPRIAREQKSNCSPIRTDELQEGDLVFFNTRGGVSHVGVYLHNNYFVHASTSGGVMVSSLQEAYWQKRFLGAGRPVASAHVEALTSQ